MTYYIDQHCGVVDPHCGVVDPHCGVVDPHCGIGDGLSHESPRRDYRDLDLVPGDRVLFKRGSFVRDSLYRKAGTPENYIYYGAYGEGRNPIFCGSVDLSAPEKWREERPNVWSCTDLPSTEACNFIFDGGRLGATLRWREIDLERQGDWHDTRMGIKNPEKSALYLYSRGNPGEVYSSIECAVWGRRSLSSNVSCTEIEDIIFFGSGVHVLSGGAAHMTVRRCSFLYIGGAVWNRQLKIRFGNAIEFWDYGENILIEDCYFNNIFDSAITHQGGAECKPAKNLVMRNNLFINYGMGAYEGRDVMSIGSAFNDNLCIGAGGGFSAFGDTMPRGSEIYPEPMGHHLFMWRIPKATDGGRLEVKRNRFYGATGAAVYSILAPEADAQMELESNYYFVGENRVEPGRIKGIDFGIASYRSDLSAGTLLTRVGGENYPPDGFERYLASGREPGAELVSPDIEAEALAWFESTGCGRFTEALFSDLPEAKIYFVGSTERDSLAYKVGEEIRFSIKLKAEHGEVSCAKFSYKCETDDGFRDSGVVDASEKFDYSVTLSKPGFVHLTVTPLGADGNQLVGSRPFEGGACADFGEITQAGDEPSDFDEVWSRMLSDELDPVKPELLEKREFVCGDPADAVYDVKIACPGKYPVSGYLRIPRNAAERSLPIYVSYLGYSTTSAKVPGKLDAIQLSLNQHGIENGRQQSYYTELERGEFAGFGFDREQNQRPETVYFKQMIFRAIQAVRFCETLPEWDGKNVTVSGGSMGAFQAVSAAAHEPTVTALDIFIPWMCDLQSAKLGRMQGWRPAPDAGILYYDTISQARRVKCPTKISVGLGDYCCPPSGEAALFNALGCEKSITFTQNRTHGCIMPEYAEYKR